MRAMCFRFIWATSFPLGIRQDRTPASDAESAGGMRGTVACAVHEMCVQP
jgi:hypothetical protein